MAGDASEAAGGLTPCATSPAPSRRSASESGRQRGKKS